MTRTALAVSVLFLIGAATASAQIKGGKIPWKKDAKAGIAEARRSGLPMMLYFTSKG